MDDLATRSLENIPITMLRPHMGGFPDPPLPDGYSMRLYRPGEAALWFKIVAAGERFLTITPETFDKEFGHDLPAVEERMFFLMDPAGRAIGTTTAWHAPNLKGDGLDYGRVHWVAIHPDAQGRGLCKPLLSVVMKWLARRYDRAVLGTSSGRTVALKCYLDFGFVPDLSADRAIEGWSQVRSRLSHPALASIPALK